MKSRFVEYLRKSRQKGDNKNVTKNSQIKNAFLANLRNSMPNQSCSPIIKCLKQPAVLTIYNEQWNECSHSDKSNIHGKVECYIWLSIVNHQQHSLDVGLLKDKKNLRFGTRRMLVNSWEKSGAKCLIFKKKRSKNNCSYSDKYRIICVRCELTFYNCLLWRAFLKTLWLHFKIKNVFTQNVADRFYRANSDVHVSKCCFGKIVVHCPMAHSIWISSACIQVPQCRCMV